MRKHSWLTGMAVVIGLALSAAAEPEQKTDSQAAVAGISSADSLDLLVDEWYQATLAGDDTQANNLEKHVVRNLMIDIDQAQARFTAMQDRARSKESGANASLANAEPTAGSLQDSIEFLRSAINVKKILLGTIVKSDAFSNKYRLMGDYIELIRREVGLPKLKLAADKSNSVQKN